ncbi:MAG: Rieske (2Fe-2S) protein [Candidatus Omnitrophica bacterium]|nr:Rieske (2Fe-2S) protein [Candidatus Omnitrophota bacterium]
MLLPALEYIWPVTRRGPVGGANDVGRADDIPVGSAKKVDVSGTPLILIHTPQGFNAFSAICTHLGCLVGWDSQKQLIACPCHAGLFDTTGRVVAGPPPRPLASYPVNVVDGKIFIKL